MSGSFVLRIVRSLEPTVSSGESRLGDVSGIGRRTSRPRNGKKAQIARVVLSIDDRLFLYPSCESRRALGALTKAGGTPASAGRAACTRHAGKREGCGMDTYLDGDVLCKPRRETFGGGEMDLTGTSHQNAQFLLVRSSVVRQSVHGRAMAISLGVIEHTIQIP